MTPTSARISSCLPLRAVPAVVALALAPVASAQPWPSKPVRLMVSASPGGAMDTLARISGQAMSERLGQPVVVENRPGAGGALGGEIVARSPADGYTLNINSIAHAVLPSANRKLSYSPERDLATVSVMANGPNVLVVHPSLPAKSVKELIALARSKPGALTFASSGTGSTQHLAGEMFMNLTGTKLIHVPFKGSGQAIQDLIGGHVSLNFDTMPPVLEHIRNGKLRALAVTTPRRASQLPEVPTLEELGLKGFEMTNWYGLMAPGSTPRALVNQINADGNRVMKEPAIREKLVAVGTDIGGGTPEEFDAFLRTELAKYARLVKATGVVVDN